MTLADTLRDGERLLREHRVDVPELTARVLLADALGRDQAWLVAHAEDRIHPESEASYRQMVRSRCSGTPTQYIRGIQEFCELEFRVTPDVLIPRPETEHLVEAAIERIRPGNRVVDIGTGSGAIAVALAKQVPDAAITASDISIAAVKVAADNARRLGVDVRFCIADLGEAFRTRRFDIVVSNPPYVPLRDAGGLPKELRHEPSVALYGGEDGLRIFERLVEEVPRILMPEGWLLAEIGFGSRPGLERILDRPEWAEPEFLPDLAGIDRVVAVRRARRQSDA